MPEPSGEAQAEPAAAMRARVRASFERQTMMTTLGAELVSVERGQVELAIRHDARDCYGARLRARPATASHQPVVALTMVVATAARTSVPGPFASGPVPGLIEAAS